MTTPRPTIRFTGELELAGPWTPAAERLGVTAHLIRRWMARREIPFFKVGRRVVFALRDLEAFEARRRIDANDRRGGNPRSPGPRER